MNLEAITEKIVITYKIRYIVPIFVFLFFSIGWIYNELNPFFAFIMSIMISFFIYLVLSMKNLCKSLVLSHYVFFLLLNLYFLFFTPILLLLIVNYLNYYKLLINFDFIIFGFVLILIFLDSIGIVRIFRRVKKLDFKEIQKSQLKIGIAVFFGHLVYFFVLNSLFRYFGYIYAY
jgi:hypothetical protein